MDKEYLTDGVYIHHDGFQIWLTTCRGPVVHEIALEPEALEMINAYWERVKRKYQREGE